MTISSREPSGEPIDKWEVQLRKGSLELAILASLWSGKLYGLEILRRLEETSGLIVPEATVYPLLNRLKTTGIVDAEWVSGTTGHPRKYYHLTATGRRRALEMTRFWSKFSKNLDRVLAPLRKEHP
jgi:PadR family transcriptional regulator PadR